MIDFKVINVGKFHELFFYDVHGWSNICVGMNANIVTVNKTNIYYALYKTYILNESVYLIKRTRLIKS